MASPGKYNFTIQRGGTDVRFFRCKDATGAAYPLDGLQLRMQIRTLEGAIGTTTTTTLVLEILQGDGIDFSLTPGEIVLEFTPAHTYVMCPLNERTQVSYGIELFAPLTGAVTPLLQGVITVTPEVVRP